MFAEDNSPDFHELIRKRTRRTAFIVGAAVILLATLRVVLTRFYVCPEIHFYTADAGMLAQAFDWAVAAGVIGLYLLSMFLYKHRKDGDVYPAEAAAFVQGTQTQVFSASVAGFLLAASAVLQAWSLFAGSQLPAPEALADFIRHDAFGFLIFFVAILSSVYFFKTAALSREAGEQEYSQFHIIMSLMPVMWAFLHTFQCFFDMSRSVNSPVRVYELMSVLALSAYFVSEARMVVGRRGSARFFTFAYIAIIFVALSALPNLILSSFWIMQTNSTQIVYATQLAIALYIAARVYSQIRYGEFRLELCLAQEPPAKREMLLNNIIEKVQEDD